MAAVSITAAKEEVSLRRAGGWGRVGEGEAEEFNPGDRCSCPCETKDNSGGAVWLGWWSARPMC